MILRDDRFSEKVSPYLRPNVPYVCGRAAAWSKPCHNGPTVNGTCGGTSECFPHNENGRWICRRPAAAGGPCNQGPLPDGGCSRTLTACQPRRTVRKIRGRISVMVAAIVIATIATFGFSFGGSEQLGSSLDAGPLSSNHQNFTAEAGCGACHAAHDSGAMGWLGAVVTSSGPSDNCTNCHQFKNPVNGPHNSALMASKHPMATSCTMCHTEHKGENANITTISNAQCNSCHQQEFVSFASNHKQFSNTYPFRKRTAIAFNHSSHFNKHFKDARYEKNVPAKGCIGCHDATQAGRAVPVRGFEETCAACHQDNITNRPLVLFTFPELEDNPFNIEDIIKSRGLFAEDREEALENIQALTDQLSESSGAALVANAAELRVTAQSGVTAGKKAAIRELANLVASNATQLAPQNSDSDAEEALTGLKEAVSKLTSNAKKAMNSLSEEVYGEIEEALEGMEEGLEELAEMDISEKSKSLITDMNSVAALLSERLGELEAEEEFEPISSETLSPTSAALMDVDGEEVEEYAEAVETLISGILEDGVSAIAELISEAGGDSDIMLHGLSNEIAGSAAAAWAANREYEPIGETVEKGWYANEFSLIYRPPSHSDTVMKSWLEFAAQKGSEPLNEALLSRSDGAGACIKCHAISTTNAGDSSLKKGDQKLKIEWKSHTSGGSQFVKYSHKPHLNLLGPGTWCTSCHKINDKAEFEAAFKQLDPHKFSSNFNSVTKQTCVECHGGGQVSQQCLTCHQYHQEPGFKKAMMQRVANNK